MHVYQVSPALTIIEKHTSERLARLFGFDGEFTGGISQPGGSASNATSLVVARNTMFPDTKTQGSAGLNLAVFTSAHSHYSVSKAAMICGIGTSNVFQVPVNAKGEMDPEQLEAMIDKVRDQGHQPFYVNATAGTTVLGSFDPLPQIANLCRKHNLWMHVDAAWGGSIIFSSKHRQKLEGIHLADSITIDPHKMLGVPITCSFLLGQDMRQFRAANSTKAEYLFHDDTSDDDEDDEPLENSSAPSAAEEETWDLANLTLQCGRKGDSLKMALAWIYYGAEGFAAQIDHAYEIAYHLTSLIKDAGSEFELVSQDPPPCLQVCFYCYIGNGNRNHRDDKSGSLFNTGAQLSGKNNTRMTRKIARRLISKGFLIDRAPGGVKGEFLRVVVNSNTRRDTVERLIATIRDASKGR